MPTIDEQVGASTDDCQRVLIPDYWNLTEAEIFCGSHASYHQFGAGMRFQAVALPQGCFIDTAYLTFRASTATAATTVRSRISAEDVDDAPTFADNATAFDNRWANRTIARIDWDNIPAWTVGTDYNSPSIVSVIQEIVDRAGWASGNDIVIFWEDFEDRSSHVDDAIRIAYSYDGSTTYPPRLHIEYGETHYGAATLSGAGMLAGIGRGIFIGQSTLSGLGTLAAIGRRILTGISTLTGAGSLTAIGRRILTGISTLTGAGSLTAIGRRIFTGATTLSGIGLLSAIGRRVYQSEVTLSGVGSLTGIAHITAIGKATLSGVGSLAITAIAIYERYFIKPVIAWLNSIPKTGRYGKRGD